MSVCIYITHTVPDCGSGIGRVTKRLLLPLFSSVDMVEQNEAFLQRSQAYLGPEGERVERKISKGLQVCGYIMIVSNKRVTVVIIILIKGVFP